MKARTFVTILILIFAVLIIAGSYATASNTKLFLQSVRSGDIAEVIRLIDAGVDVNVQDKAGRTALMQASSHGHQEVAKVLIEAGAKEY